LPKTVASGAASVRRAQARRGNTPTDTLPSGIVSWYKAEDNAGDAIGNNHGTAHAVTYGPGMVGRAFQFDGRGYVRVPDAPNLNLAGTRAWKLEFDGNSKMVNSRLVLAVLSKASEGA
jgi:hypothetical protein